VGKGYIAWKNAGVESDAFAPAFFFVSLVVVVVVVVVAA
jgi:hypothetical protein